MGAWWLGFIVTGTVVLLSSIPFFFLPKSLPKQGQKQEQIQSKSTELATKTEQEQFLPEETQEKPVKFQEMAKGNSLLARAFSLTDLKESLVKMHNFVYITARFKFPFSII